jgi:hypothetical protein
MILRSATSLLRRAAPPNTNGVNTAEFFVVLLSTSDDIDIDTRIVH